MPEIHQINKPLFSISLVSILFSFLVSDALSAAFPADIRVPDPDNPLIYESVIRNTNVELFKYWDQYRIGDIDGDGQIDRVVVSRDSKNAKLLLGRLKERKEILSFDGASDGTVDLVSAKDEHLNVLPAGDMNADGIDDWVFMVNSALSPYSQGGGPPNSAWLIYGRTQYPAEMTTDQLLQLPHTILYTEENSFASQDRSPVAVGDITGDGIDDIVLLRSISAELQAVVIAGKPGGVDDMPLDSRRQLWHGAGRTEHASSFRLVSLGDINRDGVDDIGIYKLFGNSGANIIFGGQPTFQLENSTENPMDTRLGNIPVGAGFAIERGAVVLAAADIDRDGHNDILTSGRNLVRVYKSRELWPLVLDPDVDDNVSDRLVIEAQFSDKVGYAGDLNDDGYDDWYIAQRGGISLPRAGILRVILKTPSDASTIDLGRLDGSNGFTIEGSISGQAVSGYQKYAGDVTGDGIDDLLVDNVWYRGDERRTSIYWLSGSPDTGDRPVSPQSLTNSLISQDYIRLDWSYSNSSAPVTFRLYRDDVLLSELDASVRRFTDRDVAIGRVYHYEMTAVDAQGNESPAVSLRVSTEDINFPFLYGDSYGNGVYELFWAGPAATYFVYRDGVEVDQVNGQSLMQYLEASKSYTWHVEIEQRRPSDERLLRLRSNDFSVPLTGTVTIPPSMPSGVEIVSYGPTLFELFWDRDSRATPPVQYEIRYDGEIVGVTDGTSFMLDFIEVSEQSRSFEIIAIGADGVRVSSLSYFFDYQEAFRISLPAQVRFLKYDRSQLSTGEVDLSWSLRDLGQPVSQYRIYLDDNPVGLTTQQRFTLTGLAPDREYKVSIETIGENGSVAPYPYGPYSSILKTPGGPLVPQKIRALGYGPTLVEVIWDRSAGTTTVFDYELFRDGEYLETVRGNSFMDYSVTNGATYRYQVRAIARNGGALSALSDTAVVTTAER